VRGIINEDFVDLTQETSHNLELVAGAVDQVDGLVAARLQHHAHQALVDHRRGPTALGHQDLVQCHCLLLCSATVALCNSRKPSAFPVGRLSA